GDLPRARHTPPIPHSPIRREPYVVRNEIQRPELVVVTPPSPVAQCVEVPEHLILSRHHSPSRHPNSSTPTTQTTPRQAIPARPSTPATGSAAIAGTRLSKPAERWAEGGAVHEVVDGPLTDKPAAWLILSKDEI